MGKKQSLLLLMAGIIFILLVVSFMMNPYQNYLILSLFIIGAIIFFFFRRFEIRQIKTREIVIIAMLAAIAAISRVPFAGIPSVQPTSFFIITSGFVFGIPAKGTREIAAKI